MIKTNPENESLLARFSPTARSVEPTNRHQQKHSTDNLFRHESHKNKSSFEITTTRLGHNEMC